LALKKKVATLKASRAKRIREANLRKKKLAATRRKAALKRRQQMLARRQAYVRKVKAQRNAAKRK